jgi:ribonuclease T1
MLICHKLGIGLLFALLLGFVTFIQVQAELPRELVARSQHVAPQGKILSIGTIAVGDLPSEAKATLKHIKHGGPFPYPKDGTTFNNRERRLPARARGYYREYTVKTPERRDRGARRIIAGADGEFYYTDDHYNTFRLIKE